MTSHPFETIHNHFLRLKDVITIVKYTNNNYKKNCNKSIEINSICRNICKISVFTILIFRDTYSSYEYLRYIF